MPTTQSERPIHNWAGNHQFRMREFAQPRTVEEVQALVVQAAQVKVVGAAHSFNHIADSSDLMLSLAALPDGVTIDRDAATVTVNAGITYGRLCALLHAEGWAIHNMASLPHITVGGAIATATHGSGDAHGNLATAVAGLEIVTASGAIVNLTRGDADFAGAVVSLGGLGVVSAVTLDVRPAFSMQQTLYENLPTAQLVQDFDGVMSAGYSVSLFTNWQSDGVNQVWLKTVVDDDSGTMELPATFFGATRAREAMRPSGHGSPEGCTAQLGEAGPWHERLPHFRVDYTPASGNELQTEYFVPRRYAVDAMQAVAGLAPRLAPLLIITEVRTVAQDELWLSQAYGEAHVGIHFSWHNDWPAVRDFLPLLEEALTPFAPRPHWGKLFVMSPEVVQARYPRIDDFRALLHRYDPTGKFRNDYLQQVIFA